MLTEQSPETLQPPTLVRKVLADASNARIAPQLRDTITRLNGVRHPSDQELFRLTVGGRDAYSDMPLSLLQERIPIAAYVPVVEAFPSDAAHQAAALCWMARGLAVDLAIRKVRLDLNRHK